MHQHQPPCTPPLGEVVFAHANGYVAGTYAVMLAALAERGWRVSAPERLAHDPQRPPTSNWPHLVAELLSKIEQATPAPCWLVGHSMGGYLSLMAALATPQRVRGVVLLDAPLLGGWRAALVRVAKASGLITRVSPGVISQKRRERWADLEAVCAHFAAKPLFARWSPQVLRDYCAHGTEAVAVQVPGRRLRFERRIETAIYNTLPHHLGALLHGQPPPWPLGFVGGSESVEVRQVGLRLTRRLCAAHNMVWLPGSHLFPMELPLQTAAQIDQMLRTWSGIKKG